MSVCELHLKVDINGIQDQMKKQRWVEKDGLIVTSFGGLHRYKDADAAIREVVELNKDRKQLYELVINDDDLDLDISNEEGRMLIELIKSTYKNFERCVMAVVATKDDVFGMSRMLELSIGNERMAVSVFRSEALARSWIQEMRATEGSSPQSAI